MYNLQRFFPRLRTAAAGGRCLHTPPRPLVVFGVPHRDMTTGTFEEYKKPMSTHAKYRGKSHDTNDDVINNGHYQASSGSTATKRKQTHSGDNHRSPYERARESAPDQKDKSGSLLQKAAELGQMAKEKIKEGLHQASNVTAAARDKVGEGLSALGEKVHTKSEDVSSSVSSTTAAARDKVGEGLSTLGEKVHTKPGDVSAAHSVTSAARDKVGEGLSALGEKVHTKPEDVSSASSTIAAKHTTDETTKKSSKTGVHSYEPGVSKTTAERQHEYPSKTEVEDKLKDAKHKLKGGKHVEGLSNMGTESKTDLKSSSKPSIDTSSSQFTELSEKNPFNIPSIDKKDNADYGAFKDVDRRGSGPTSNLNYTGVGMSFPGADLSSGTGTALGMGTLSHELGAKGPEEAAPSVSQGVFSSAPRMDNRDKQDRMEAAWSSTSDKRSEAKDLKDSMDSKKIKDRNLANNMDSSKRDSTTGGPTLGMHMDSPSSINAAENKTSGDQDNVLGSNNYGPIAGTHFDSVSDTNEEESPTDKFLNTDKQDKDKKEKSSKAKKDTTTTGNSLGQGSYGVDNKSGSKEPANWEKLNESGDASKLGKMGSDSSKSSEKSIHKQNLDNPQKNSIGAMGSTGSMDTTTLSSDAEKDKHDHEVHDSYPGPHENKPDERSVGGQYAKSGSPTHRDNDLPTSGDQWKPLN